MLQYPVARLVTQRVVDRLEPVDVDEQHRQRQLEARVPLQLAVHHLLEESTVVAPGERIGDRGLQQLLARRLEPPVRRAELVGHVLEHQEVHAERAEDRQHGIDHEQLDDRAGRRGGAGQEDGGRDAADRDAEQHERDEAGADHPALDHHGRVHRRCRAEDDGIDDVAGHEGAGRAEQRRDQQPRAKGGGDLPADGVHVARLPEDVRAPQDQRARADHQGLRQTQRRALEDHVRVWAIDEQHRRPEQGPGRGPDEDEGLAPVRELQQEQDADNRGAERAELARIDRDQPWRQNHTSSSSASSARSMMNRKRAEASLPISSLMMRSVTI